MKQQIDNRHRVYGYWDDCSDCQFMVYTNAESKSLDVYMMEGSDYGGGISRIYRVEGPVIAGLESILEQHATADGFSFRAQVGAYCQTHGVILEYNSEYSKEYQ